MRERIAGVVILFDPSESVLRNIQTYLPDVEVLYVIDNSPGLSKSVVETIKNFDKVEYLTLGKNIGVAAALNIAAHKAIDERFDYLLTMDQDSSVSNGMVPTMLSYADIDSSVGLIAPFYLDRNAPKSAPDQDLEPVVTAITSGSLVSLTKYKEIGGFLEKLFIDYVDVEYCLRLQVQGFQVVRVNRATISHTIGDLKPRRFLGMTVHPTNHSPARFFYQTRNRVYVRRQYRKHFPQYFSYEARVHRGRLVKMLLYEKNRVRKSIMVLRGLLAGWRNDFSQIPMQ